MKAWESSLINLNPLKIHAAISSRALCKLQLGRASYRMGTNPYLLPSLEEPTVARLQGAPRSDSHLPHTLYQWHCQETARRLRPLSSWALLPTSSCRQWCAGERGSQPGSSTQSELRKPAQGYIHSRASSLGQWLCFPMASL